MTKTAPPGQPPPPQGPVEEPSSQKLDTPESAASPVTEKWQCCVYCQRQSEVIVCYYISFLV